MARSPYIIPRLSLPVVCSDQISSGAGLTAVSPFPLPFVSQFSHISSFSPVSPALLATFQVYQAKTVFTVSGVGSLT